MVELDHANFLKSLETQFGECRIKECKEQGCKLICDKRKFRYFIIFKGEKITKKLTESIKICDCFIYCDFSNADSLIVALVELKSESIKPREIKEKFNNSAEKIKYMISICNGINTTKIKFFPILLSRKINPIDRKAIAMISIRFEKDYSLINKKCGADLLEIIKSYTL